MLRVLTSIYFKQLLNEPPRDLLYAHRKYNYYLNALSKNTLSVSRWTRKFSTDNQRVKVEFKVKKASAVFPFNAVSTIKQTNVNLDDVEILLPGKNLVINQTWLRDSCHCAKCTHQYSRQRLFIAKDFRRDLFSVKEIHLSQDIELPMGHGRNGCRQLHVSWVDGHESKYSLDWLLHINSLYKRSQLRLDNPTERIIFEHPKDGFYAMNKENNLELDLWNVQNINSKLKPVNYWQLIDSFNHEVIHDANFINTNIINDMTSTRFESMLNLTEQLVKFGLAKIQDVPRERDQVLKIAKSLAYDRPTGYGVVFDVTVEPSEEINLAYSSLEFDLHTDLPYRESSPGVQLLHCIRNSASGGLSYFSDSFKAAKDLQESDPVLFKVLLQFFITFAVRDPYRQMNFRRHRPIINLDSEGNLSEVYYSPFTLPPIGFRDDVKLFYLALDKFTRILHSNENKLVSKMEPGDLFIFNNRRVLHGRSAYDAATSNRFLQGCYMDWDEIESLREKLRSHPTQYQIKTK